MFIACTGIVILLTKEHTVGMEEHDLFTCSRCGAHQSHFIKQTVASDQICGQTDSMGPHRIASTVIIVGHLQETRRAA